MEDNILNGCMMKLGVQISKNPYLDLNILKFNLPDMYKKFLVNYSYNMNENENSYQIYCREIDEYIGIFDTLPSKYFSFDDVLKTYNDSFGDSYFPVFKANGGGDIIVLRNDEKVYYWFHEEDKFYLIANSFKKALTLLKIYEDDGLESKAIGSRGWN